MYLQKLEIQGFKSFAHKTTLQFTPGITAVVGPNGTGKSNVADAVRWVLGEQSMKLLRGKKSEDVIFAGSDKKTRMGFCQVDLYLNNEDRQSPIDYSEIVISRRLYRNGEGEYLINKNKVRLQDIIMLLAKSSFGQRSYSIISQGMADFILNLSPAERKSFFDEAAGVRQFQLKKEQAQHKLAATEENLKKAELIIQEIAPRVRSLTRQVHRLERREETEKQLKELQRQYYSSLWFDLNKQYKEREGEYKKAEEKKMNIEKSVADIQKQLEVMASGSSRHEIFQNLQKQYHTLLDENNKYLKEQAVVDGKIEIDYEQKGNLNIVWLAQREKELEKNTENLEQEQKELNDKINEYSQALALKNKEQVKLENDINDLEKELKEKLTPLEAMAVPEIAQELDNIYSHHQAFLENLEKIETVEELAQIKEEARKLANRLAYLSQKIKGISSTSAKDILEMQEKISALVKNKEALVKELSELNIKLQVQEEKSVLINDNFAKTRQEYEKVKKELDNIKTPKTKEEKQAFWEKEKSQIEQKIKEAEQRLKEISDKIANFNREEETKKDKLLAHQKDFSHKQNELKEATADSNAIKIELAKLEIKKEDLDKEMRQEVSSEEREAYRQVKNPAKPNLALFDEIQKLKRNLELIGGIDPQVAGEYEQTKERYDFLTNQSNDLKKAIQDLDKAIANLEETIKKQFNQSFDQINKQFTQYFRILFNGGSAKLALVKEVPKELEEELEESLEGTEAEKETEKTEEVSPPPQEERRVKEIVGVEIHAQPAGKRLKNINMLSGGERALTSIALICAIIHINPSPFVFLDEVDAALDESNSIRFASIIERLSKKTQFIVVTHNRATMHKASILYGVTMGDDGVSRLLSIKMEEAEDVIKQRKT